MFQYTPFQLHFKRCKRKTCQVPRQRMDSWGEDTDDAYWNPRALQLDTIHVVNSIKTHCPLAKEQSLNCTNNALSLQEARDIISWSPAIPCRISERCQTVCHLCPVPNTTWSQKKMSSKHSNFQPLEVKDHQAQVRIHRHPGANNQVPCAVLVYSWCLYWFPSDFISVHLFHGDRCRKRQVSHCWRLLVSKWSEIAFFFLAYPVWLEEISTDSKVPTDTPEFINTTRSLNP